MDLYLPGVDAWQPDILPPLGCVPDDGSSVRGRSGLALHLASEGSTELLYAVGGNIGISLPTRCDESSVPPVIDLVFGDGFKTASTSRWSAAVP